LWTAASLRLMLPVVSGSALQIAISSSCHDTIAPSSSRRVFSVARLTAWNSLLDYLLIRCLAKALLGNH